MPSNKNPADLSGRAVFLREFVRHLIINSKPKLSISQETIERIRKRVSEEIPPEISPVQVQRKPLVTSNLNRTGQVQRNPLAKRMPVRFPPQMRPFQKVPQKMQMPAFRTVAVNAQKPVETALTSLTKLQPFLKDPAVVSVECPGSGKNLVLNRSGVMQTIPATLSVEEISAVLKDFSEKTKIPLIQGVFKALYNNLLITAIVSESAGNRFIIEKHFSTPELPKQEKK